MFSKLVEEKNKIKIYQSSDSSTVKINNSTAPYNGIQSALVKLNVDDADNDLNFNETEINKIEEKLGRIKNPELFTRENQISRAVDEVIEVPKKKIRDEAYILSDDKKQNQIKKQILELEKEEEKEKRKIETDINKQRIKDYKDKVQKIRNKNNKKIIIFFLKYLLLIILIAAFLIFLIIFLDK